VAEIVVSASEFRVKMKDLVNAVAEEQHRVIVTRHGGRMMVVVSQEDFEFLQKHKPQPTPRPVPDPVPDVTEGIDDPEQMKLPDIERIYAATEGSEDEFVLSWRNRARIEMRMRAYYERVRPRSATAEQGLMKEPAA
jgi:prevent-host-death family protein